MSRFIEEISHFVENLFNSKLSPLFTYHNFQHTRSVADTASEIADHYRLPEEEKELILISAWFHDSGYIISINNHEEHSNVIAEDYLKERNYPDDRIEIIKKMILSTKLPRNPQNFLEEILCDADIAYIGSEHLPEKIKHLRMEWENTINKFYTDYEWLNKNINFIEVNPFHTEYARKIFADARADNLRNLKKFASEIKNNPSPV